MKTFLISTVCVMLAGCDNSNLTDQEEKAQIDKLLAGEEILVSEMARHRDRPHQIYKPEDTARYLGYSEEDLKKLESAVIKLPKPKEK